MTEKKVNKREKEAGWRVLVLLLFFIFLVSKKKKFFRRVFGFLYVDIILKTFFSLNKSAFLSFLGKIHILELSFF